MVRPSSRVVVTAGGNLAFMNALLAIADVGDEIILPTPYYFNHEMAVVMAGAVAVPVPTTHDYQLDLDAIAAAITPRTRAVAIITSSAGTRPLPSARGTRRCEITALRIDESWMRTCFCW